MSINQQIAELRVTIEEIAAAKGVTYLEELDRIFGAFDPLPPLPPTPHQPVGGGSAACVRWCQACRLDLVGRKASRR